MKSKAIVSKDVDSYLAKVPEPARSTLEKIRSIIRETAPDAEEVITYAIPGYKYHGMLVAFAAFKNHCSLFGMGKEATQVFKEELSEYKTSPGTIQFPQDKPLPKALVQKIVKMRMKQNEMRELTKIRKKAAIKKSATAKKSAAKK
ncbi:MAG: hypothetical protein C5B52_06320 [Bacteroidetes bacterium]|nr:MAG: hypothetical protein C5B52_06320 [Bacteroidota bacterium]